MTSSLVGSEMCIRDRHWATGKQLCQRPCRCGTRMALVPCSKVDAWRDACLLYTSDAADDM
eukprot:5280906-Prorocentrum_lima.AAC.1